MPEHRAVINFHLCIEFPHRLVEIHFFSEPPASDDLEESHKEKASALHTSYDIQLDQARELSKALESSIEMLEDFENWSSSPQS